jgi:hypothetical protein
LRQPKSKGEEFDVSVDYSDIDYSRAWRIKHYFICLSGTARLCEVAASAQLFNLIHSNFAIIPPQKKRYGKDIISPCLSGVMKAILEFNQ